MKKILLLLLSVAAFNAKAQRAWSEPAEVTDPEQSLTIFVDVADAYNGDNPTSECDNMIGWTEDMYAWWWGASGVPGGDWGNYGGDSTLRWTHRTDIGPDVWSYTMVPTVFYSATAQQVYDSDIHFLLRAYNAGSGGCGNGELKTGDMLIRVDPAFVPVRKVRTYPKVTNAQAQVPFRKDDIVTVMYDPSKETSPNLISQNGNIPFYVYIEIKGSDNIVYKVVLFTQADNTPELRMQYDAVNNLYYLSFVPEDIIALPTALPANVQISELKFKIMKENAAALSDLVGDEDNNNLKDFKFYPICD